MNNYTNPVTVTGNPASFEASGDGKLLSLSVPFSPIQDLHGYSHPWPGGGGKNKLVLTASDIKALNNLTWTNNAATSNGITFTIIEDAAGNVTGIQANGTASATAQITISKTNISQGIYYLSGEYYSSTAFIRGVFRDANNAAISIGGSVFTDLTIGEAYREVPSNVAYISVYINITSGTNVNNVIFKPMLRDSTESSVFAPSSNICPISGRTGLNVYVGPTQDPDDATTYAVDWTSEAGTVYGGTLDVVTGVLTVDRANIASYNGEVINEPWLSSMDEYAPGATPTTGAQVVYKLATPITYQLTPQEIEALVGENNVWSDSNEAVTLTYVIELFTRYTFIVNGNDYTGLVERDSYRTAVTPVYGETIQTLDGVGHTALLRVKGSLTVKLNPQTAAQTAAICADLLNAPCEVQYKCLQRNVNVTALMVLDAVSAMFLSRCLYLGQKWNDVDEIVLKEL